MRKLILGLFILAILFTAPAAHAAQALTADRVQETTTTTGTGTVTLAGAVTGYRTFAAAFSTGNLIQYAIVSDSGTEWEVGNGTLATTSTLSRDTIVASSNAGSAVNFSAGSKHIFATLHGTTANSTVLGPTSATDECFARWDLTTGKLLQNSIVCVTDAGVITGGTQFNLDNLRLDGNTLSSTDTNGNIVLAPNGSGVVVVPTAGIGFSGDATTGIRHQAAWYVEIMSGGGVKFYCNLNGCFLASTLDANSSYITGFRGVVTKSTAGSGAPLVLSITESSGTWSNEGSTATNYVTLPPASTNGGFTYTYCIQDSDGGRLYAGAGDTIRRVASVTSTAGYIASTTIGSCVTVRDMNATEWFVISTNDVGTDSWSFN